MFTDRKVPSANEGTDHSSEGSSDMYLWLSQGNFN